MDTPPQPAPPTNLGWSSGGQPPRCVGCGYSLQGLPGSGRCPECGCPYTLHDLPLYRGRPPFGWLLLAILPAATPFLLYFAALFILMGGCVVVPVEAFLVLAFTIEIARHVAEWRYGVALRRYTGIKPFPTRGTFLLRATILFALLQLAACCVTGSTFWILAPWLVEVGVLPRLGWS